METVDPSEKDHIISWEKLVSYIADVENHHKELVSR